RWKIQSGWLNRIALSTKARSVISPRKRNSSSDFRERPNTSLPPSRSLRASHEPINPSIPVMKNRLDTVRASYRDGQFDHLAKPHTQHSQFASPLIHLPHFPKAGSSLRSLA